MSLYDVASLSNLQIEAVEEFKRRYPVSRVVEELKEQVGEFNELIIQLNGLRTKTINLINDYLLITYFLASFGCLTLPSLYGCQWSTVDRFYQILSVVDIYKLFNEFHG
jgi:hypothetical protein